MTTRYKHTQAGYVVGGVVGGMALGAGALLAKKALIGAVLPGLAVLGTVGAVFSRLTIEVTDEELTARFGGGWPVKRVRLADIESVTPVRNPWYYGWGIRVTPRGMLYNVSGRDAVEIRMRSGTTFRLGTDEPTRLRDAIQAALDALPG